MFNDDTQLVSRAECSLVGEAWPLQTGALKIPGGTADVVLVRMPTVPGLTGLGWISHLTKLGGGRGRSIFSRQFYPKIEVGYFFIIKKSKTTTIL